MSANRVTSSSGVLYANIGRKRDGTYTLRIYLVGDGAEYPDMETWYQDGFLSREQAREWAAASMRASEVSNGWGAAA